jgi:hypothetical protein
MMPSADILVASKNGLPTAAPAIAIAIGRA